MRPTQAIIDLEAIKHNVRQIRAQLAPGSCLTAVVKANAYGHGSIAVSRAALAAGADCLAVAIPEEGAELRAAGFTVPILLLGLTLPEQFKTIITHNLTATVSSLDNVNELNACAQRLQKKARIMAKVDTGMGRIGIPPAKLLSFVKECYNKPFLELHGLFTHLATADADDKSYAHQQLALFQAAVTQVKAAGITLPYISAANSAAIMDLPSGHFNTVRPGIVLYGLPPSTEIKHQLALRPAMELKTKVVYIKKVPPGTKIGYGCTYTVPKTTYIATLPIGYADGYSRHLSNIAPVLIGGKRRKVVGRVCMDQVMVDIGEVCDVSVGDEAVLFGRQGEEEITVTELADLAGTINYELLCAISSRVPRVYINDK